MKKWIIALGILAVASAAATTSFDRVNALKEELKLHHVDGKKAEATLVASNLALGGENEPYVSGPLQEELAALDATVTNTSLDKAINFLTGKKVETYCEGQGMVEMSGSHNDGSTSHLALVRSNRLMSNNSFSQVDSGDWTYDFTDSYRHPSNSDLLMVTGGANSYHLKEVRNNANGKEDTGDYSATWSTGKMNQSVRTQGEVLEPIPMFMALDFQLWGNNDLGYKIKFEPGFKDAQETTERTATKNIVLQSERSVGEVIPLVQVVDSSNETHEYKNCYQVTYQIKVKKIEDRQLVIDGKVNKEMVQRSIRRNRSQVRACYEKALDIDPTLKGSVTFSWDINDKGKVAEPKMASRSLTGDGELEDREAMIQCITDRIKNWKFPSAPKGQEVHVSYPFTFRE